MSYKLGLIALLGCLTACCIASWVSIHARRLNDLADVAAPSGDRSKVQSTPNLRPPVADCPAQYDLGGWSEYSDRSEDDEAAYSICYPRDFLVLADAQFEEVQNENQSSTPSNNDAEDITIFTYPAASLIGTIEGADMFATASRGLCYRSGQFADRTVLSNGVSYQVKSTEWAAGGEEGAGEVWSRESDGWCLSVGWFEWDLNPRDRYSEEERSAISVATRANDSFRGWIEVDFKQALATFQL